MKAEQKMQSVTDRFDAHSISQESASEHQNTQIGLDDLNDEQLQNQIEEIRWKFFFDKICIFYPEEQHKT